MFGIIAISTVLGTLTASGIGGGSLLMLWLLNVQNMDFTQAKSINLLFFIPAACISCFRKRKYVTHYKYELLLSAFIGCTVSFIFSNISKNWNIDILKRFYGAILVVIACRELSFLKVKSSEQ